LINPFCFHFKKSKNNVFGAKSMAIFQQ